MCFFVKTIKLDLGLPRAAVWGETKGFQDVETVILSDQFPLWRVYICAYKYTLHYIFNLIYPLGTSDIQIYTGTVYVMESVYILSIPSI